VKILSKILTLPPLGKITADAHARGLFKRFHSNMTLCMQSQQLKTGLHVSESFNEKRIVDCVMCLMEPTGPAFSRLDRLLPIGLCAKGGLLTYTKLHFLLKLLM